MPSLFAYSVSVIWSTVALHIYACQAPPAANHMLQQQLLHAVRVGDGKDIRSLHEKHPDLINTHIALQESWCLTLGKADSHAISPQNLAYYTTPLIEATKSRQTESVEILVKLGAQLNSVDSWGNTAEYYAHLLPTQPACAYQALRLLLKKQTPNANIHACSIPQPTMHEIVLKNDDEKP